MSTPDTDQRTGPLIVVGVDGSAAGNAALRWAVREATRQHGSVRAVVVLPAAELMPATSFAIEPHGLRQPEPDVAAHTERLRVLIGQATAGIDEPAPIVALTVIGDPDTELAKSAGDADLLVIGSHGQSALAEVFLGSVAAATIRQAPCPIVLIPGRLADED